MRELPIIFSTEMVRAILYGRKTQTRRVIKPQPIELEIGENYVYWVSEKGTLKSDMETAINLRCRYQKGDLLWVKETWRPGYMEDICFKADIEPPLNLKWKSPLYMPKKYARLWLDITDTRIERLQDITWDDALSEGFDALSEGFDGIHDFNQYWDLIYKEKPEYQWDKNPWIQVLEFRRIEK